MRYMLLIYHDEKQEAKQTPGEQAEMMAGYRVFTELVRGRNAMLGGEPLHPTSAATTVRVRDGKALTTDGPFAETKEQLGGFYMLECKDLDEAIDYAARIPGALRGSIESAR